MALYFLGFALVFVFGCGVPGSGGALCSYQGVVGENLFVKIKEVVHWVLAVSFLFLFIISSVVFRANLLLLRELGRNNSRPCKNHRKIRRFTHMHYKNHVPN